MKLQLWKRENDKAVREGSRSVLWTWAVSYIIVLFIPLITVFINYQINVETIKQGIIKANELTLYNIRDNADNLLEMEKVYHNYIFSNNSMGTLQCRTDVDDSFYNDVAGLFKELKIYGSGNSAMHGAVWLRNRDYIISDRTANRATGYYEVLDYVAADMMPYDEWREILQGVYNNQFFVAPDIFSEKGEPSIYFANTPKSIIGESYTILITLELKEIARLTEYGGTDAYLILYADGQPAAAFRQGEIVEVQQLQGQENGKAEWITLQADSLEKGLSYALMISEETLWNNLRDTRGTFLLNVMLTLAFGIVGTIILLRRNYRPVQQLLREIEEDIIGGNEFRKISEKYDMLRRENLASLGKLNRQKNELLSSRLLSMMKGRTISVPASEPDGEIGLNMRGEIALVGFMLPVSDRMNIQYDELLFFIVENIFEELTESKKRYRVEDGRFLIYLFDLQEESEESWEKYVLEQVEYLCSVLEEKWEVSLSAVISSAESGMDNIRFLYRKIMESFEYQSVIGGSGVISTRMLESQEERSFLMEYVRSELCDALKEGDQERMLQASGKFFRSLDGLSYMVGKMYAFDAFTIVAEMFRELVADSARRAEVLPYAEQLTVAKNTEDLRNCFERMLEFVCSEIVLQYNQKNGSIVDQIKECITLNYQDQNLNISAIAEILERNPKYLSRIFKENTGEGMLDYINSYRITRAKALLTTRRYTVEEVAAMVGYTNVRTFRRIFTKLTGDIPSRYVED